MDNEQMLDRIQHIMLGLEERTHMRFDQVNQQFHEVNRRFDGVDQRFDRVEQRLDRVEGRLDRVDQRLGSVEGKLDSVARELSLNNELLAPFIRWSHRVEDEVIRLSSELQAVQARLAKLEKSPSQ